MGRFVLVLGLMLGLVLGCGSGRKPADVAPRIAPRVSSAALVTDLSIVTRARPPSPEERATWPGRIDRGEATFAAYIDDLLASPAFAEVVAPEMTLGESLLVWPVHLARWTFTLQTPPEAQGRPIYYLTEPCARTAAVRVHPW